MQKIVGRDECTRRDMKFLRGTEYRLLMHHNCSIKAHFPAWDCTCDQRASRKSHSKGAKRRARDLMVLDQSGQSHQGRRGCMTTAAARESERGAGVVKAGGRRQTRRADGGCSCWWSVYPRVMVGGVAACAVLGSNSEIGEPLPPLTVDVGTLLEQRSDC